VAKAEEERDSSVLKRGGEGWADSSGSDDGAEAVGVAAASKRAREIFSHPMVSKSRSSD
jgi:hypothetical protein